MWEKPVNRRTYQILINLAWMELNAAADVVPKKWISELNRELAVALLHIDEQQVEVRFPSRYADYSILSFSSTGLRVVSSVMQVWKSALLNMQTVHHVESSAHMYVI